jgi:hypothetical protein
MPENPQSHKTTDKLSSSFVDVAGELLTSGIDLVPDGAVDAAIEMGGNLLEGTVEAGKAALEGAAEILGDSL